MPFLASETGVRPTEIPEHGHEALRVSLLSETVATAPVRGSGNPAVGHQGFAL